MHRSNSRFLSLSFCSNDSVTATYHTSNKTKDRRIQSFSRRYSQRRRGSIRDSLSTYNYLSLHRSHHSMCNYSHILFISRPSSTSWNSERFKFISIYRITKSVCLLTSTRFFVDLYFIPYFSHHWATVSSNVLKWSCFWNHALSA